MRLNGEILLFDCAGSCCQAIRKVLENKLENTNKQTRIVVVATVVAVAASQQLTQCKMSTSLTDFLRLLLILHSSHTLHSL